MINARSMGGHERSWLYVPAIRRNWYPKLASTDADVVVLDLEDGISESEKTAARIVLRHERETLRRLKRPVFVRVNSVGTRHFAEDMKVVRRIASLLKGIVLPKVARTSEIRTADRKVRGTGLEIVPVIELLEGERNLLPIITASRRIGTVQFAESGDYSADFGLFGRTFDASRDPVAIDFVIAVLKASKMTGKSVIDGAHLDIRDRTGLKKRCLWAFEMGFDGKAALHPAQCGVINRAMTPSPRRIREAAEMVRIYEGARRRGSFVPHRGSFITPPKYKAARKFLRVYGRRD